MIMSSKGEGRKTPQQHDDNHDAAPPTGIAAPEQNKEQINLYARAGPTSGEWGAAALASQPSKIQ